MATFAGILQYHGHNNTTGNFDVQISYVVCNDVALTAFCGITPVLSLTPATSSTWYDQIAQAVVDDAATRGYTVTTGAVRVLRHVPGDRPPVCVLRWTKDVTRTNIPATYTNVYNGLNGEPQLASFSTYAQYRLVVHVNKVGTGTQDVALVDVTNAANLISLSDTAAAGEHALDSGWVNLPAWMTGELTIKPMARSSVVTDDPVYRQFQLYLR